MHAGERTLAQPIDGDGAKGYLHHVQPRSRERPEAGHIRGPRSATPDNADASGGPAPDRCAVARQSTCSAAPAPQAIRCARSDSGTLVRPKREGRVSSSIGSSARVAEGETRICWFQCRPQQSIEVAQKIWGQSRARHTLGFCLTGTRRKPDRESIRFPIQVFQTSDKNLPSIAKQRHTRRKNP